MSLKKKIFGSGGVKGQYMKAKEKAYGKRGVKGRYYRAGASQGLKNLAADIEMIKGRLNVEKKYKDSDISTFTLGQCSGSADGARYMDLTTPISQGLGRDDRIGNSLKVTGMTMPMSFTQMFDCQADRKIRITLLRVRAADNGVTAQEAFEQVWDVNPLNGLRDFNAPRAYRNSKSDGIAVLRSKVVFLKGPQLRDTSSSTTINDERQVANLRFNLKLDDTWRYKLDADSFPDGVKYYLIFQCNAGNASNAVSSALDVPVTGVNTGVEVRLGQRCWWVDN